MSWAAPPGLPQESWTDIRAMLRRRKSPAKLDWHLERPKPRVYVYAVARLITYRTRAAITLSMAISLFAFLGVIAGNIGYPRWPNIKDIKPQLLIDAAASAPAQAGRWVPAFIAIGVVTICVVGAGNRVTSCDLRVFVDQAAEPVPAQNAHTVRFGRWMRASGGRVLL